MSSSPHDFTPTPAMFQRGSVFGWTFQQWSWACGAYSIARFERADQVEAFRARWDKEQSLGPGPGRIQLPGRFQYPTAPLAAFDAFRLCAQS